MARVQMDTNSSVGFLSTEFAGVKPGRIEGKLESDLQAIRIRRGDGKTELKPNRKEVDVAKKVWPL